MKTAALPVYSLPSPQSHLLPCGLTLHEIIILLIAFHVITSVVVFEIFCGSVPLECLLPKRAGTYLPSRGAFAQIRSLGAAPCRSAIVTPKPTHNMATAIPGVAKKSWST
mmetsp:Transcript_23094/g.55671  ORF Transcript_23094/g.55671 Transcript_23094/m.55671 type:complete len:110 (-) Transcript_23094:119-448(-)